jgi:Zn-dependent M28 family amino/carboxypeptidase
MTSKAALYHSFLALLLVLAGLACSPTQAAAGTARLPLGAVSQTVLAAELEAVTFDPASAKHHVDMLAGAIGSRPAGSEAQERAAQYIYDELSRLGYQTEFQRFPITFFEDRGSTLTVAGALGGVVPALTLQYSAAGTVDGELVDVGLGRPGDFDPAAVRGKIALIRRGEIRFSDKVDQVSAAGAAAAIIYNNQPGTFSGSLVTPPQIPVAAISDGDGEALLQRTRLETVVARLAVDASMQSRTAANVIGTRPGGPQTVVIGGHFDSIAAGPGANDNASGTAVMLELARVLAARPTPFTLKFAAFDAEEIGLRGSAHMVSQLTAEQRAATRAMLNLDMVGVGDQPRFGGSDELTRIAFQVARRLGQTAQPLGDGGFGGSDHASFMRADIPALFLYRSNDPNYHSPNDRPDYVDPDNLAFAGSIVVEVLDAIAGGG